MPERDWENGYLRLHPMAGLKRLEKLYLYHVARDELYELSDSAEPFLTRCDGTRKGAELTSDRQFVAYCMSEGLLEVLPHPKPGPAKTAEGPQPSLRYLELQLSHRCNLKCRHCYLGQPRPKELTLEEALRIAHEFAAQGGLRLLISGGEPLLYTHLRDFIKETADLKVRRVLFTNGTLITGKNAHWLGVEEIQFSLDGWREGHDILRGPGSFEQTLRGIRAVRKAGISLSIATMIHRGNLREFDKLKGLAEEVEAIEWGVDVLCMAGRLKDNPELAVSHEEAVPLMSYAYGGGYHGASDGFACGRHLMTVMPSGKAAKCGFYENRPLGDAREGLIDCWLRLKHTRLEELACRGCPVLETCCGGCRFRAHDPLAPDPVMCAFYGLATAPG